MSRSFKKVPGIVDRNTFAKNQANRKVRHIETDLLANGKMYKKFYCSYNICDWIKLSLTQKGRTYLEEWKNKWDYERK